MDDKSIKEHLIAARALIDTPEKWAACPGRITGAMRLALKGKVGRDFSNQLASIRLAIEEVRAGRTTLEEWQMHPTTTRTDALALFDRAIAAQEPSHDQR